MKNPILSLGMLSAALVIASSASAGSTTAPMNVTANLLPSCIVSASTMTFGDITRGTAATGNGEIAVICHQDLPYNIAIDAGQNFGGQRNLSNGAGGLIGYLLGKDAGLTQWGDSDYANTYPAGTSLAGVGIGNGVANFHTVYGYAMAGNSPTGSYTDVVTVTVYY